MKRPDLELSAQALGAVMAYPWPGNVRQLQNEMRRATVCARGPMIEISDLSEALQARARETVAAPAPAARAAAKSLQEDVEELEKQRIREVLAACGFNQVRTARQLGLSRQGLINKDVYKRQVQPLSSLVASGQIAMGDLVEVEDEADERLSFNLVGQDLSTQEMSEVAGPWVQPWLQLAAALGEAPCPTTAPLV